MSGNPPSNYLEELLKALEGHGGLNPPTPKPTGLAALFATPPQPNALTLASLSSPPKSTLGGLFGLASPPTPTPPALGTTNPFFKPQPSALGFFGVPPKPASTGNPFANLKSTPKIRRVFYSFHYADIFRVNHIRKAGQFRLVDEQRLPTPQDRSLWEEAKLKNPGGIDQLARLPLLMIEGLIGLWERHSLPFDDRLLSSEGILAQQAMR